MTLYEGLYTNTCVQCTRPFVLGNPCWNDEGYVESSSDASSDHLGYAHTGGVCAECAARVYANTTSGLSARRFLDGAAQ